MSADLLALVRTPRPAVGRREAAVLVTLAVLALVAAGTYLVVGVQGGWEFVLPFRGRRLAGLVVVGVAIAASTVVFQTLTDNRILTPSIMGFDSLYQLVQTVAVFALGSLALAAVPPTAQFGVVLVVMVVLSTALFRWLFGGARHSLHLLVLVGVVIGTMFRSVSALLQRMLDPNEFTVLQSRLFASFSTLDERLLAVTAVLVAAGVAVLLRGHRELDVLALGRPTAVALGVDHRRVVLRTLVVVAVLVSAATALVGPVTFFGLLVANLAYVLTGSHRHAVNLPAAGLLAVVVLVGGQTVLEHVLGQAAVLSVVVEFLGGIVFIAMLVTAGRRR
ncbi:iron chelate uptake ABC transporter family permease subunit [Cellulosimicrobium sp. NPDC057127]|uniref:iron chelate uptake ABC transporter family permease subunit n=1 Tax=Cellulosimicrobium sp. NPDC057127 TaxID=3346026 RepID=UPI003631F666